MTFERTCRGTRASARAPFLLLSIGALAVLGCQTTPRPVGRDVEVLEEGRLAALNPADVVVAPVRYAPAIADTRVRAPEDELRAAAQGALVRRRYSPLALDFVDDVVVESTGPDGVAEASYSPGSLREEAVLEIVVHDWDDELWSTRRTLVVDLEARMLDPEDPNGPALWAARMPKRFDFTALADLSTSERSLMREACEEIVLELLSPLPARDTSPGPR